MLIGDEENQAPRSKGSTGMLKNTLLEWAIEHNMNLLDWYWTNMTEALDHMKESPERFSGLTHDSIRIDSESIIEGHEEQLCYSGVLLAYAHLDEYLFSLCGKLGEQLEITTELSDLRDRGVRRYKKFIEKFCSIEPPTIPINWPFLFDFSIVRDSVVHANGRIDLLRNPQKLKGAVERWPKLLHFKHNGMKLVVERDFVSKCNDAVHAAAKKINNYMITHEKE